MARGRGGYRKPSNPAPASGPGALSRRTDGGPGQPIRVAPGGDYGDRQALVGQQQAAPLASAGRGQPAAPGGVSPEGIFGPTAHPGEPITAGVDTGPGPGSNQPILDDDPYLLAKALLKVAPSPQLEQLVARLSRG